MRLHLVQFAPARRAGDVAAQQLPQGFEFENFRAGFQVNLPFDFSAVRADAFGMGARSAEDRKIKWIRCELGESTID